MDKFNLKEFMEGAEPCSSVQDVQRKIEVADLKEVYSKKYLLRKGLVTEEEYNTIPASTNRSDDFEEEQRIAEIMHHVIGW